MEVYKKVKNSYIDLKNFQFGGSKFSVLSWNLSWEMQSGKSWGETWCSNKDPNNCQENVAGYLNSLNEFDLIAFQEATRTKNFENKENNSYIKYLANDMHKVKHRSGQESIVSYFNKSKFNLIDYSGSQFEKGRPILAVLLEEIKTKKKLLFINLHASHLLFHYQLTSLNKFVKDSKFDYDEILIAGDHNTDLQFFKKINQKYIIDGTEFEIPNVPTDTCCNPLRNEQVIVDKTVDYILYSRKKLNIKTGSQDKNFENYFPNTDHIPVMSSFNL